MTDEEKRNGGETVFDTDRAWDRFGKLTAREPVPAIWRQAQEKLPSASTSQETRWNGKQHNDKKDGAGEMKQTTAFRVSHESPVIEAAGNASAARTGGTDSAWRTERPGRRRLRRLAAGAAAAVVAIGLIATPLGDRALAAMMQTFRIQHIVGIGITADDLTAISSMLERGAPEGERSFSLAQFGTLTQSGGGEAGTITWSEVEKRMGTSLLQLENSTAPDYQPATTLTFNLNVQAVNRMLTRLGSTTALPAEADGKAIRLHIPDGVATEGALSGKPVRLLQFGKPELTVEGGIDAEAVREAVLGLPLLPDSLRTKLAAIGDWQNTLPVPAYDGVTTTLRLGGHEAVMAVEGSNRYLLWLDGDRMGLLSSQAKDFTTESAFQRAAEELVRP